MKKCKWHKKIVSFLLVACISIQGTGCTPLKEKVQEYQERNVDRESEQKKFDNFVEQLFLEDVQSDSITLHYTLTKPENYGIDEFTPTFGSFGAKEAKESIVTAENNYKTLTDFAYTALTKEQQLLYLLLEDYLKPEKDAEDFIYYGEVLGSTTGIQAQLPILLAEYTFYRKKDVSDYLALLPEINTYFSQIETYEKEKSEQGLFMSDTIVSRIISQCEDFIKTPEDNILIVSFKERLEKVPGLTKSEKTDYIKENKEMVYKHVIPAYESLINTLTELKGTGTNTGGICHFKNGKKYYELLAQSTSGSDKSIRQMKKALDSTSGNALIRMNNYITRDAEIYDKFFDMEFPKTNPKEILKYLEEFTQKDFPALTDVTYNVKYVDKSMEEYLSPAFYLTPPLDHSGNNSIYINGNRNNDLSRIFPTLAHEGYPGHLLQNVYFTQQNPNPLRAMLNYGGYSEGWATYCENYSYSICGVDYDLADFAKNYNVFSLCLYASIDIGVNYDGWSLEDLKKYLTDFGITDEAVAQEIFDIVIDDPANYLKYVIGYIEFEELRKKAEKTLGDNFNAKEFHTFLLDMGPAPFYIIEQYLDDWLKEQK